VVHLANYVDNADPAAHPALDALVTRAGLQPRFHRAHAGAAQARGGEAAALAALDEELAATSDDATAEELQNIVYEIGKDPHYGFETLRDWFKALYETLLLLPGPAHGQLHRAVWWQHAQVDC
jgi:lysyl-tRNA synthetase class 1